MVKNAPKLADKAAVEEAVDINPNQVKMPHFQAVVATTYVTPTTTLYSSPKSSEPKRSNK